MSTGPQLSMSLVPRISPSPPRTLGNCLHLSLCSAIIMIIVVSRSLIQLARAKLEQYTCQSKPLVNTAPYWRGCVRIPPLYPTSFASQAWAIHPLLGQSLGLSACADQVAKPPTFLETTLDWSREKRKPNGHVLDRYVLTNKNTMFDSYPFLG